MTPFLMGGDMIEYVYEDHTHLLHYLINLRLELKTWAELLDLELLLIILKALDMIK